MPFLAETRKVPNRFKKEKTFPEPRNISEEK